jgi:hypothetical protein
MKAAIGDVKWCHKAPVGYLNSNAPSGMASLITESWNQIMESLQRLETLREMVQGTPL